MLLLNQFCTSLPNPVLRQVDGSELLRLTSIFMSEIYASPQDFTDL